MGPSTSCAIRRTASKSSFEEIGNPASITSTLSLASWCAISIFSRTDSLAPGVCSASLNVVSKMTTRFD